MWLVIAEKPSVAKAIKEAMPGQFEVTICTSAICSSLPLLTDPVDLDGRRIDRILARPRA
jgi:hypothetical protein